MIIGFLARKGSGKDTCADYLVQNYNFEKMHFAKPIKDACGILFNFTHEQLYGDKKEEIDPFWKVSPRHVLQYLGTDIFRKEINKIIPDIGCNFWVTLLKKIYLDKMASNKDLKITIADVRFQNEIDMIHKLGGCVIKIIRPNLDNKDEHESEKNIDIFESDYVIINDKSKEELYSELEKILKIIN